MDQGYETYCLADPWFYDAMHSDDTAGASFLTAGRHLPNGWQRTEQDDWFVFDPGSVELPLQGWKIHVSACLDSAERVLGAVWDYCVPRGIAFKFLRSPSALVTRVSKYAARNSSGKFVTIYPPDDSTCEKILDELDEVLAGESGPYILSDLRWRDGPLYVRYGAFVMRYCVSDGQIVPAIADAAGELVPDRRGPVFQPPPWVTLPGFLQPAMAARNSVTVASLPYTIERVVHFSNGGGIYVARDDRTGRQVVLKEGRPHAGLDAWGHDAVRRVEREHAMLRRLAGIPGVPEAYDLFWLGDHRFLVMEYVEGEPLSKAIVGRYPLIDPSAAAEEFASFSDWALDIHRQAEAIIEAIHERGVVYGDLHLFNLMIRDDDTVALLDFEVAAPVEDAGAPGLGNQGFAAPQGTTGMDVDRYALACLRLALFLPMTALLWLDRQKAQHFAQVIGDHFPVPPGFLREAVDVITPSKKARAAIPRIEPDPVHWPRLREQLTSSIVASATPDRDDRLFPGDVEQFAVGGLGLAYGAAGVLYALSVTGAGRYPRFEEWLVSRVKSLAGGTRPGLYDGLHGVAFTLDHLGYQREALDLLDVCLRDDWESLGSDLAGGLAGIGVNLLHLADRTGEPALRQAGRRAAELVAERLGDEDCDGEPVGEVSGGEHPHAGLLRGSSGPALLLVRAYDDTGDVRFLDRAGLALRRDLRHCVVRDNGALEVNEGWRTMPYLDVGSIGIGLVLDEYLARRHDERFAEASRQVRRAAQAELYILPGLFSGRAGILLYLAGGRSASPLTNPLVSRQVENLAWHGLPYGGGLAFPGTGLLRLSMDLATGTAGVLLALGAALHDTPVHAPLLGPTNARVDRRGPSTPRIREGGDSNDASRPPRDDLSRAGDGPRPR